MQTIRLANPQRTVRPRLPYSVRRCAHHCARVGPERPAIRRRSASLDAQRIAGLPPRGFRTRPRHRTAMRRRRADDAARRDAIPEGRLGSAPVALRAGRCRDGYRVLFSLAELTRAPAIAPRTWSIARRQALDDMTVRCDCWSPVTRGAQQPARRDQRGGGAMTGHRLHRPWSPVACAVPCGIGLRRARDERAECCAAAPAHDRTAAATSRNRWMPRPKPTARTGRCRCPTR